MCSTHRLGISVGRPVLALAAAGEVGAAALSVVLTLGNPVNASAEDDGAGDAFATAALGVAPAALAPNVSNVPPIMNSAGTSPLFVCSRLVIDEPSWRVARTTRAAD
jgi:hypothetical protein